MTFECFKIEELALTTNDARINEKEEDNWILHFFIKVLCLCLNQAF